MDWTATVSADAYSSFGDYASYSNDDLDINSGSELNGSGDDNENCKGVECFDESLFTDWDADNGKPKSGKDKDKIDSKVKFNFYFI